MKRVAVDTSVFIRLFTRDNEERFQKTKKLVDEASKGKIQLFVPFIVIAEIVWVLEKVYKVSRERIGEVIESLVNTPGIQVELKEVILTAVRLYVEKRIKFSDAVIAPWTMINRLDNLVTFDETDFRKVDNLKVKIL